MSFANGRRAIGVATVALLAIVSTRAEPREPGGLIEEPAVGPLVLVGGELEPTNEPVFRAILGLRFDALPICVLPTTTTNAKNVAKSLVEVLERHGGPGSAKGMPQLFAKPWNADKEKVARELEGCGGYFFTDGDPVRVVDTLRPDGRSTLAEQAILRNHRRGAVIAGSNAGAALLSETMIQGGSSDDALSFGIASDKGAPGVWLRAGMGFFHGCLTDQQNSEEGRTGRLLVALAALADADRGFGIDNNTALVIRDGHARVVGRSQVLVVEEVQAGSGSVHLDGARFRILLLGNGDEYNLMNGVASVEARKETLRLDHVKPVSPSGPWLATGLPLFIVDLAVSNVQQGEFVSKGYRFTLAKESEFDARAWEIPDGKHVPHGFTAGWFRLDIGREGGTN